MIRNFAVDVETLGLESNSIVLSVGIVPFSLDDSFDYDHYLNAGKFFKFSVEKQRALNRAINKETVRWWAEQSIFLRKQSFVPYPTDYTPEYGLELMRKFIQPEPDTIFWSRGCLDQSVLDSLCRSAGVPTLVKYHNWMDFRTAITMSKENAKYGYCDIEGFDPSQVIKHDPIHDCAYDIYMLLRGQ